MNRHDAFERDVTTWLTEAASPRMPDFRDELLQRTAATRQRPGWSFLERWVPTTGITAVRRTLRPVPWRTVALLALLALLLAATAMLYAGSRPGPVPLLGPAPMLGVAGNGLVAYETGGDIYAVDPGDGSRRGLITGDTQDHAPQFSLDGTRLFFLRGDGKLDVPVIADADGRNQQPISSTGIKDVDPSSIAWSPDGHTVGLLGDIDGTVPTVYLIDVDDRTVTKPPIDYFDGKIYWRPPDGRAFMFTQGAEGAERLVTYSLDTGTVEVLDTYGSSTNLRGSGWSADGTRYAFHHLVGQSSFTKVVDTASGAWHDLAVSYGELSNDGRRIVGMDPRTGGLCVIPVDGGPCTAITEPYPQGWGWYYRWSPDDSAIITSRNDDGAEFVLDPDGPATQPQPTWMAEGAESWQRRGP